MLFDHYSEFYLDNYLDQILFKLKISLTPTDALIHPIHCYRSWH